MLSRSRHSRAGASARSTTLRGIMPRGQPDGSRIWVLRFRRDDKSRRVTFGTVTLDQSRAAASALLAREKSGGRTIPHASGPTLTRFAEEYVERHSCSRKPSTHKATMSYPHRSTHRYSGIFRVQRHAGQFEQPRNRPNSPLLVCSQPSHLGRASISDGRNHGNDIPLLS